MSTNKRSFNTVQLGHHYQVPNYDIVPSSGIVENGTMMDIIIVRGSKITIENEGRVAPAQPGTLHEHILSVMIEDLKFKQTELPSRETAIVITKLEEARHWMEERVKAREAAGVLGTYQPIPDTKG